MIVAIDLETTGLDISQERIIEIAMVEFDENTFEIGRRYSKLIHPEIEIPEFITHLTGITNEDVLDAPSWGDVEGEIEAFIGDAPILGHNINFDSSFLRSYGIELKNNIEIDTFDFANFLLLEEKSLSLEALSVSLGIELEGAHRALNDVLATIELFRILIEKLKKVPALQQRIFDYLSNRSESLSFKYVYNNIIGKKSEMYSEDDFVKDFTKLISKNTHRVHKHHDPEIDIEKSINFLDEQDGLELRGNQKKMIQLIMKNFEAQSKIAIEAPTGVGKTFAYLLPSILHSVKTGEQVFISTSTKALQDQVYYKDLVFMQKNLGVDFSFSKLKGKANYIGIAAFLHFMGGTLQLTRGETTFILKILFWLKSTVFGELDELDYYGKEYSYLHEINADDFFTFSKENSYANYEFIINARKKSKNANIVIINNNILFQDLDSDNSLLGKVENVILDEAHSLEDVVTQSLRKKVSYRDTEKHIQSIDKILMKHKSNNQKYTQSFEKLLFDLGIMFDNFYLYLNHKTRSDDMYKNILVGDDYYAMFSEDIDFKDFSLSLQIQITDILDSFSVLRDETYLDLGREIRFLEELNKIIKILLSPEKDSPYIKLLDFRDSQQELFISYTLLNIGNYLHNNLWESLQSCVITSATLQIGESFEYINKILHLEGFECTVLDSDFDYDKQALLFVPNDLGSIKNNLTNIVAFLKEFCLIVKGNTLILFTAFYAIKQTYAELAPECKKEGIHVYAQSIGGGKHKLIEAFKQNADTSILIGTDTFWEGIDIPGDSLKYLLIHKVPFAVPSDPIFQARSKMFTNAFMEYSVPKAILKLKQGFGRLIRSKTDVGIVIFLDDRIYSTGWGNVLYSAFPKEIKRRVGSSGDFIEILLSKNKV